MNLRRRRLSESDIMELCGWESRSMFKRYGVKDEIGLAERLASSFGTTSAQNENAAR